MLVLTRRGGESIRIGECVTVKILGIVGGSVRVGVEAPREVTVDREEIYQDKRLGVSQRSSRVPTTR